MSLATYPSLAGRQAQGVSQIVSLPAPVDGWNTRDSLDAMSPTDAVLLDNFIPEIGKVRSRGGYEDFVTGIAATLGGAWGSDLVETIIPVVSGSTEYLLACMDGGIVRIDTGTPSAVARPPYSNDRWQYTVFDDSSAPGSPSVLAVNGADNPWQWDGTTHGVWAPTGTGLTATDLIWVNAFKNRVFAGTAGSRDFWYGALGAIPGAMTRFPLSGIRGAQGEILFMVAMTRDTGSGPDDFAVFVTSEGQAIVYQGTDPGDATAWSLVGVYQIPRPLQSRRAYSQLFGDIVIATELDYVYLSQALQQSGGVILTPSKLTGAMQEESAKYRDNYGWELTISESDNLLLSNIPREPGATSSSGQYAQHVINVQTLAPARFTGWNFATFARWNGRLYGGGVDGVYRVNVGRNDDANGTPTRIQLCAQTAWTDLQSPKIKKIEAVRALIRSQAAFTAGYALGTDFADADAVAQNSDGPAGAETFWGDTAGVTTEWGDAAGAETFWAGAPSGTASTAREWRLLAGRGTDFALLIKANILDQSVEWLSTDYKLQAVGRF